MNAWVATTIGVVVPAHIRWMEAAGTYEFCDTSELPAQLGLDYSCWRVQRGALLAVMQQARAESERICLEYRRTKDRRLPRQFTALCAAYCRAGDILTALGPAPTGWQPCRLDVRLPQRGDPGEQLEYSYRRSPKRA